MDRRSPRTILGKPLIFYHQSNNTMEKFFSLDDILSLIVSIKYWFDEISQLSAHLTIAIDTPLHRRLSIYRILWKVPQSQTLSFQIIYCKTNCNGVSWYRPNHVKLSITSTIHRTIINFHCRLRTFPVWIMFHRDWPGWDCSVPIHSP